ncbi:MAG: ribosome silencing factor [Actinomycetota bacterium]|nr:ribosome silencing factor [Actinomycetota bacterium]
MTPERANTLSGEERRAGGEGLVLEAAEAASAKKAERIVILDVSEQLVITDYFLICSGNTQRQVRTIADAVERRLAEAHRIKPFRREGEREARWVLLDYVDFVIHVFHTDDRDYYDLERLWADARVVPFEDEWAASVASASDPRQEGGDEPAAAEAT